MPYLLPDAHQMQAVMAMPADQPLHMLNLLRFHDETAAEGLAGRKLYARYAERVGPLLEELGVRVVYAGDVLTTVVGPGADGWHRMMIVAYPSRDHFIRLSRDPRFIAASADRTAALADWRLLAIDPGRGRL